MRKSEKETDQELFRSGPKKITGRDWVRGRFYGKFSMKGERGENIVGVECALTSSKEHGAQSQRGKPNSF